MCDNHAKALPRRALVTATAIGLAAGSLASGGIARRAYAQAAAPAPNAIAPDDALKVLMEGNARYIANATENRDYSAGRAARAAAQYPIAGLLSCADSRVAPELVFDQGPGELFVVRVAGNFVSTDGLASLEYGVQILGLPLIMVLGHSGCGAVAATIKVLKEGTQLPGHLPALVSAIRPAIDMAEKAKAADPLAAAITQNVRYNVARLHKATPIIAEAAATGRIKIIGGVYDIGTGRVSLV
ncbi:MAG TPA: carbonic anhydrase [Acidisoma sp.]|uniref:carbonic anhydrase n=1 Tax=Acidisoma sp. TaxID=1872115 RepID=UPI002CD79191|nr:carbonic anhydrase [Acidisoma sp.]HTI03314.1 carbonic anhydrase [Acidisoma sp.]